MRFQYSQKNTTSLNSKSNREMEKKQKSLQVRMLKDSLERSLQDLMSIYRDILFIKSGIYDLVSNQDVFAELTEVNERITSSKCVQNIISIMTSKNQVSSNVTPSLLIENLFCEIVTP